jgi:hypothetical protein
MLAAAGVFFLALSALAFVFRLHRGIYRRYPYEQFLLVGAASVYTPELATAVDSFRKAEDLSTPESGSPSGLVDRETVDRLWERLEASGKAASVRERIREVTAVTRWALLLFLPRGTPQRYEAITLHRQRPVFPEPDPFGFEKSFLEVGRHVAMLGRDPARGVNDTLPGDVAGTLVHGPSDRAGRERPAQELRDLSVAHHPSAWYPADDGVNLVPGTRSAHVRCETRLRNASGASARTAPVKLKAA